MHILLANIGNRDVQLTSPVRLAEGREIDNYLLQKNCRTNGHFLLEHLSQHNNILFYPMLQQIIHELIEKQQIRLDRLVLFYTDQNDVEYQKSDTLYFADILESWLTQNYSHSIGEISKVKVDHNPADYDLMYEFYEQKLPNIVADLPQAVYACLSGGTPAMNHTLMFHTMKNYEHRVSCFYMNQTRDSPTQLKIDKTMRKKEISDALRILISRHDYLGAREVLNKYRDLFSEEYTIVHDVLSYAHHRVCFDFENAMRKLSTYTSNDACSKIRQEISSSQGASRHLEELIGNAKILFEQGNYLDFLARLYRFQEAALKTMIDLQQLSISNRNPNREDMKKLIRSTRNETLIQSVRRLNKLDKLITLRNNSPVAHGFKGVSFEIIQANYPVQTGQLLDEILQDMSTVYRVLFDKMPNTEIFTNTQKLLHELLLLPSV